MQKNLIGLKNLGNEKEDWFSAPEIPALSGNQAREFRFLLNLMETPHPNGTNYAEKSPERDKSFQA